MGFNDAKSFSKESDNFRPSRKNGNGSGWSLQDIRLKNLIALGGVLALTVFAEGIPGADAAQTDHSTRTGNELVRHPHSGRYDGYEVGWANTQPSKSSLLA